MLDAFKKILRFTVYAFIQYPQTSIWKQVSGNKYLETSIQFLPHHHFLHQLFPQRFIYSFYYFFFLIKQFIF